VKLTKKWKQLRDYLEMIPIEQDNSFRLEAVNGRTVSCLGLLNNDEFKMDWVALDSSVETRWVIQDHGINFLVSAGSLEIRYRLNDNVHTKPLASEQSVRIPPGVPFQLVTYEKKCSVLLISKGDKNDGSCQ